MSVKLLLNQLISIKHLIAAGLQGHLNAWLSSLDTPLRLAAQHVLTQFNQDFYHILHERAQGNPACQNIQQVFIEAILGIADTNQPGLIHFKTANEILFEPQLIIIEDDDQQSKTLASMQTFLTHPDYQIAINFLSARIDDLLDLGALYEHHILSKMATIYSPTASPDAAVPSSRIFVMPPRVIDPASQVPQLKRTDSTTYCGQADFWQKIQKMTVRRTEQKTALQEISIARAALLPLILPPPLTPSDVILSIK